MVFNYRQCPKGTVSKVELMIYESGAQSSVGCPYQPVAVLSGVGHFQRKYMRVLSGQTKVSVLSRCPKGGIPL